MARSATPVAGLRRFMAASSRAGSMKARAEDAPASFPWWGAGRQWTLLGFVDDRPAPDEPRLIGSIRGNFPNGLLATGRRTPSMPPSAMFRVTSSLNRLAHSPTLGSPTNGSLHQDG